ncbi:hypothetical protein V6N13_091763 [Hibiscus sabdariffa]
MSLSSGKEFFLWKAIKSPPIVVADDTPEWSLESSCQFSVSLVYQFREGSAGLEEDQISALLAKYRVPHSPIYPETIVRHWSKPP